MINGGDTDQNLAARQNLAWGLCQADTDGNYTLRSDLPDEGIEGGKIGGPITPDACTAMITGEGGQNKPGFVLSLPFSDTVSPDKTVKEVTDIQFSVVGDVSLLSDPANGLADPKQASSFGANSAGPSATANNTLAPA